MTTVVILAHNGWRYTQQCLDSLLYKPDQAIVVVDNASTDETHDELDQMTDEVVHIRQDENLGWAGGNNAGMKFAFMLGSCDSVVLLNNDIIVSPGWLEGMVEVAKSDDKIGLVGPMLTKVKGGAQRHAKIPTNFADFYRLAEKNRQEHEGEIGEPHGCDEDGIKYPFISGAAMFFKREVYERVGEIDTRFVYFEDDDYCLRADRAGFKLAVAKGVWLYHHGEKTYTGMGQDTNQLMVDSRKKFREKWAGENPDN
jgi:GT2 family glycosyltransferase